MLSSVQTTPMGCASGSTESFIIPPDILGSREGEPQPVAEYPPGDTKYG